MLLLQRKRKYKNTEDSSRRDQQIAMGLKHPQIRRVHQQSTTTTTTTNTTTVITKNTSFKSTRSNLIFAKLQNQHSREMKAPRLLSDGTARTSWRALAIRWCTRSASPLGNMPAVTEWNLSKTPTGQGETRQDRTKTGQDKTRHVKTGQDKTRKDRTR